MNLSYGSRGDEVKKLQQTLNSSGYGLVEDGIYGQKTQAAVRDYQTKNGLSVDGIAGEQTLGKLYGTSTGTTQNSPTTTSQESQQQTTVPSTSFVSDPASNPAYSKASGAYQEALAQGAPQYNSIYDDQMNALFDKIMNRQDFSYDLKNDPMYAQYRDQYTQQGQMAMMDTMGQAAALTGGYDNTYGQAVGQQQYNAYLQQLNDIVPELYDRAYARYQQEGQDLMDQYTITAEREADDYGRYMDSYNQYWDNIYFLQGEEDTAYNRGLEADETAYGRQQDAKSYLLDLMAATGYVPSAEELAAAGMSQGEADAWLNLYATKGGGGYVTTDDDWDDGYLDTVAQQMGMKTNLAARLALLDQNKDNLSSNEYRELYNALIKPYENGSGQGGGHSYTTVKKTGMTR